MEHRHLVSPEGTPVEQLDSAALDDILDRGDIADWAPLAAAVRRDPDGALAQRLLALVQAHPMYGTSPLWRDWITGLRRARALHAGAGLRRAREQLGLTQQEVANRLGMTQPEVSKLERRPDVRISSAAAYVRALGGELDLVARLPGGDVKLG